jgi:hypothetical protein
MSCAYGCKFQWDNNKTASPIIDTGRQSLLKEMTSHVHISEVNMSSLKVGMCDGDGVDATTLAKNFGIGIEAAKRKRLVTTQRGVKQMIHPSLSVRFRTNDMQLRYRRLPVTWFTDIMFSNSKSRQGNKASQFFVLQKDEQELFTWQKKMMHMSHSLWYFTGMVLMILI